MIYWKIALEYSKYGRVYLNAQGIYTIINSFLIILNQTLIMYRINRKGYYKRKTTKIPRPFTNASFKGNNDIWCHTRANVTKHIPSLIITPNFLWTFSVKTYIRVKPHKMVYSMWDTNTRGKIVSCYYVKCYFIGG